MWQAQPGENLHVCVCAAVSVWTPHPADRQLPVTRLSMTPFCRLEKNSTARKMWTGDRKPRGRGSFTACKPVSYPHWHEHISPRTAANAPLWPPSSKSIDVFIASKAQILLFFKFCCHPSSYICHDPPIHTTTTTTTLLYSTQPGENRRMQSGNQAKRRSSFSSSDSDKTKPLVSLRRSGSSKRVQLSQYIKVQTAAE